MRVLRIYHSGGASHQRARERALAALGADVTLVVPSDWREGDSQTFESAPSLKIVPLDVVRSGDVNRHSYRDFAATPLI